MKLGLQFSSVSETIEVFSGLNDESMTVRDLRPLLSKFVYNQSRRTFLYVFSFSSSGITMNVVCTRDNGGPGDYDAATVSIPSGARIEGGKLATLINLLKEELVVPVTGRQSPSLSTYCKYFEEDHQEDEFPVLPDPKSHSTAFLVFGYGQTHSSLVRLLISLYRPSYSNFGDVVMIDIQESISPALSADLTNLSSFPLPPPSILFRVDVAGGIRPEGMIVDGVFASHFPIFVNNKISLGFQHSMFSHSPQTMQIPPDGIIRIREVNWDIKISKSDFNILTPDSVPVSDCSIYINGRFLSNTIVISVSEALSADVSIEARTFHSFRSRLDLTQPSSYDILLTNSRLVSKFYVGNDISFTLKNAGSEGRRSPLKGYRSVPTSRDAEYRLVYDWLIFLKTPFFYFFSVILMALAFYLGMQFSVLPDGTLRQHRPLKIDHRPGLELFKSKDDSTVVAADNLQPSKDSAAPVIFVENVAESVADAVTEDNAVDQTVQESAGDDETVSEILERKAFDYVQTTQVWNRDSMEAIPQLKGLWDAVNHYDYTKIDAINSKVNSPFLSDLSAKLRASVKKNFYVLYPNPEDGNAKKNITISIYVSKLTPK